MLMMKHVQYMVLGYLCMSIMQITGHGFVADTPVYIGCDKPRSIKNVCCNIVNRKKQYISSFDDKKFKWKMARVGTVGHAHINCSITIQFDDDADHNIICSPSQSFYHAHTKTWTPSYKIRPGDLLLTAYGGTVQVSAVSYHKNLTVVYLLEVKRTHTFCVGYYQVLTHNTPLTIPITCALLLSLSGSFGSGAAAGATAGSFFGPITCAGGLVIGGLIGIGAACLFAGPKIRRYDMFFNMQEIEDRFPINIIYQHDSDPNNRSKTDVNRPAGSSGGGADNDPEDNNNRKGTIDNMAKFFQVSKFGKDIKDKVEKTKKIQQNQAVYRVEKNIPEYGLKKGDQFYLDNLHKDHLEVFHKDGTAKMVLNLNGTKNIKKTSAAWNRRINE